MKLNSAFNYFVNCYHKYLSSYLEFTFPSEDRYSFYIQAYNKDAILILSLETPHSKSLAYNAWDNFEEQVETMKSSPPEFPIDVFDHFMEKLLDKPISPQILEDLRKQCFSTHVQVFYGYYEEVEQVCPSKKIDLISLQKFLFKHRLIDEATLIEKSLELMYEAASLGKDSQYKRNYKLM